MCEKAVSMYSQITQSRRFLSIKGRKESPSMDREVRKVSLM